MSINNFNTSLKLAPINESVQKLANHDSFKKQPLASLTSPRAPSQSTQTFNDQASMVSNFSKILMSEPALIRQSGRILKPQIDRRIEQLENCQLELDKKCLMVTERELSRIQNLRNRFDQKSRELMADIDREFQEKKVILREKIYRESEKRQKLDYLLGLHDDESVLRAWPDIERSEIGGDKLDPFNVVGMGHSLRVQTPPIQIDTTDLRKSIEGVSIRNLSTSTPNPFRASSTSNYKLNASSVHLPAVDNSLSLGIQPGFIWIEIMF